METKTPTPHQILDRAVAEFGNTRQRRFVEVVALYSGGYDSAVTAHVAHDWAKRHGHSMKFTAVSVDTLLSADGWREYVQKYTRQMRWPHIIMDNPEPDWYFDWTAENGFPYSPSTHTIAYQRLKERAILAYMASVKRRRSDRVLFCSGIRQSESRERMKLSAPINHPRRGSAVFVNPIFYWGEQEKTDYMVAHDMPMDNPFYETVGGSGDCSCNWGQFVTMETFAQHSPIRAAEIEPHHQACRARHGYGWGERPSRYAQRIARGQMPMFSDEGLPVLCFGCRREKAGQGEALATAVMDRMDWNS